MVTSGPDAEDSRSGGGEFIGARKFGGMDFGLVMRGWGRVGVAAGVGIALVGAGAAVSQAGGWWPRAPHVFRVVGDSFSGHSKVSGDVLRNDSGATAVVRHSSPAHGTVTLGADGGFVYTPKPGFKGTDSFTYTATDAVQVFRNSEAGGGALAPLAKVAGRVGVLRRFLVRDSGRRWPRCPVGLGTSTG